MKKLSLILISFMMLAASACAVMADSGSWRYRMTVNVETPEGMKSGSAVREVTVERAGVYLPERGPSPKVKGEAVVVDLGERGQVYALLKSEMTVDYAGHIVFWAFPGGGGTTEKGLKYYSNLKNAKTDLDIDQLPMFVHFKNPANPTSVELVYTSGRCEKSTPTGVSSKPCVKEDRFEEIYGAGVKLHSVTLEMTDDSVTTGIEKWLPWLPAVYTTRLDGKRTEFLAPHLKSLANGLGGGDFSAKTLEEN